MTRARIFSQILSGNVSLSGLGGSANITLAALSPFLTTANVIELTNLYFSNARVYANLQLTSLNDLYDVNTTNKANGQALIWTGDIWAPGNVSIATLTTDDIREGVSNLYYTNARARTALTAADPTIVIDWVAGTIRANIEAVSAASGTTDTIPEGSVNKYFTNARVFANLQLASINDLFDVNIINVANNNILKYNDVTGKWENGQGSDTVLSIANFTTDDLVEGANNKYLTFVTLANVLANVSIDKLLDVNTQANLSTGSVLTWNGSQWVPEFTNTGSLIVGVANLALFANFANVANLSNLSLLVSSLSNFTTANLLESNVNLYYTNARVLSAVNPRLTTANVIETSANLYFTNARVVTTVTPLLTTANVIETSNNLYYTNARVLAALANSIIVTKDLTVNGNITVNGDLALLNVSNVQISSKTITIAKDAGTAIQAEGSGIYINGANASITYNATQDAFGVNKNITVYGNILPAISGIFNIGSQSKLFRSIFLGTQTIYLGNVTMGETPKGGLAVTTATGDPSDGAFANVSATQSITVDRVYGNVFPLTEFNSYIGGNVDQFLNNVTGNLYFGIRKNADWNKFAGIRVTEVRGPDGNVRSDVIIYNDKENSNNSTARISVLGTGNVEIHTDLNVQGNIKTVGTVTGTKFYGNVLANTILTDGISANTARLGNIVVGTASFDSVSVKTGTFDDVIIQNNLRIYGSVETYNSNNISISDNMIYLNNGSNTSNPDIGFAFNYNDGVYHHGGFFRDASDGAFKVFDNYAPEPDANIFINTDHATFRLANLQATNFIGNVTGYVTGQVSSLGNHSTTDLAEGTNQYFTNTRVLQVVQPLLTTANIIDDSGKFFSNIKALEAITPFLTTANVIESPSNLYYTDARVLANVEQMSINVFADVDITGVSLNKALVWNGTRFVPGDAVGSSSQFAYVANVANLVLSLDNFTTANLAEGVNLYYTNARVLSYITAPILGNITATGIITANTIVANNITTGSGIGGSITGLDSLVTSSLYATNVIANVWIGLYTANVIESPTNQFFTNARAVTAVTPLLTTANVIETTNQYFTNVRVLQAVNPLLTTANIVETTNLYFTNARVLANVEQMSINVLADVDITGIQNEGILVWNGSKFIAGTTTTANTATFAIRSNIALFAFEANIANIVLSLDNLTTTDLKEGSNLYFTAARVVNTVTPLLTTANVIESPTSLYFTNARVVTAVTTNPLIGNVTVTENITANNIAANNIIIGSGAGGFVSGLDSLFAINIYASNVTANVWNGLFTANVIESPTSLYFTNARVVTAVTNNPLIGDVTVTGRISSNTIVANSVTVSNNLSTNTFVSSSLITNTINANSLVVKNALTTSARITNTISPNATLLTSFSSSVYRSAEFIYTVIGIGDITRYNSGKMLVLHDDIDVYFTQYGILLTGDGLELAEFTSDINNGNVRIFATVIQPNIVCNVTLSGTTYTET
jgi:hypothetical protein